jgi:hypothetical protein
MRSMLTLAIAGLIAAAALAPASAATKSKRVPAPAQSEYAPEALQQAPVAARPGLPGACFTDEGYGRFTSCDVGGGS